MIYWLQYVYMQLIIIGGAGASGSEAEPLANMTTFNGIKIASVLFLDKKK